MAPLAQLPGETAKKLEEFETNVELYGERLAAAGTKFALLSAFGHFYVWVQHFAFPVGMAAFAIYMLLHALALTARLPRRRSSSHRSFLPSPIAHHSPRDNRVCLGAECGRGNCIIVRLMLGRPR